ncbi:MAG: metallophosphoesterase family protein [Edaphobacter sp.]|uniref:metallophosphoesterase family protein n=1 Tax=Edaphobacter sp. TaxID=1934404 RepID=UPI00238E5FA3|nr:metallophosphoesterase family protein [Edaphobacter sp.]MDE1178247.1 metallophosphoesterase family protein [Edaphobacter sp.]
MRFLILSDIHANWEALTAVLEDAASRHYQAVLCLGDIVGYGPNPNEVAAWVRTHADVVIRGNHDKACSGSTAFDSFNLLAQCSSRWTREQLLDDHTQWLRNLDRGPVLVENFDLVHGAPDDEDRYMFHEHEAEAGLRSASEQLTFFGHTHVQGGFVSELYRRSLEVSRLHALPDQMAILADRRYLLNPGAVGQPRDGNSRAAYCVYDSAMRIVEFCRVEYDIRTVQDKILAAGLPEELAFRLASGD